MALGGASVNLHNRIIRGEGLHKMRSHLRLFTAPVAIAAAGVFLCASDIAFAQSGVDPDATGEGQIIDQIVVVAHKDERSIREIAANVTVLSRAELSGELATSLADIFRYMPGVDYEAGGTRFGTEGINIRGIGGNRVAILVDGVPLADQFDTGSFSNATRDFSTPVLCKVLKSSTGLRRRFTAVRPSVALSRFAVRIRRTSFEVKAAVATSWEPGVARTAVHTDRRCSPWVTSRLAC